MWRKKIHAFRSILDTIPLNVIKCVKECREKQKKYKKCKIRLDLIGNVFLKKYLSWQGKGISQRGGREMPN